MGKHPLLVGPKGMKRGPEFLIMESSCGRGSNLDALCRAVAVRVFHWDFMTSENIFDDDF